MTQKRRVFRGLVAVIAALSLVLTCIGRITVQAEGESTEANTTLAGTETEEETTQAEAETEEETTKSETEEETAGTETEGETTVPETEGETAVPETEGETAVPETEGETVVPEANGETAVPETEGETAVPEANGETRESVTATEGETTGAEPKAGADATGSGLTKPDTGVIAEGSWGASGKKVDWWIVDREDVPGEYTLYLKGQADGAELKKCTNNSSETPWADNRDKITKVVIGNNIVKIGDKVFRDHAALRNVEFEENSTLKTVAAGVFRDTSIERIEFPDTLQVLGKNCFVDCSSLTYCDLGAGIVEVKEKALQRCTGLTELGISDKIATIGPSAFYTIANLKTVYVHGTWENFTTVTKGSTELGYLADPNVVYYCDGEGEDRTVPHTYGADVIGATEADTVTSYLEIGSELLTIRRKGAMKDFGDASETPWSGCKVSTLVIMDDVTRIGANAFADISPAKIIYFGTQEQWDALAAASAPDFAAFLEGKTVELKAAGPVSEKINYVMINNGDETYTLTVTGEGEMPNWTSRTEQPWYYAQKLISKVVVGEGITTVGDYVFDNLTGMTDLELAGTVKVILYFSFRNCVGLETVKLPEGLENCGFNSFSQCSRIKTLHLPTSLRAIDLKAFNLCTSIENVIYAGTEYMWNHELVIDNAGGQNDTVANPRNLQCAAAPQASAFNDVDESNPYYDAMNYLYGMKLISGVENSFFPERYLSSQEVVEILYRIAGNDCIHDSAADWAVESGLTADKTAYPMTADKLAELLMKTAEYNGADMTSAAAEVPGWATTEALKWASGKGYFDRVLEVEGSVDPEAVLTRAQGCAVLAAYREDTANSIADRSNRIFALVGGAIANGGDGKLYVVGNNINTPNLPTKVGDSALIVFPDGKVMLLDAGKGTAAGTLVEFLKNMGVTKLDYLVASHAHDDHVGGMSAVIDYLDSVGGTVGELWTNGTNITDSSMIKEAYDKLMAKGVTHREFIADTPITEQIGDVTITFFAPTQARVDAANAGTPDDVVNNSSLVMKFTYGTSTYLTGGDTYIEAEEWLVDTYGDQLQSDIVKANHHGNLQSNGAKWIEAVKPKVCITEIDGNGNFMVMSRYLDHGAEFYTTGFDGAIVVAMDNAKNYEVITQYDSFLRSVPKDRAVTVKAAADSAEMVVLNEFTALPGSEFSFSVNAGERLDQVILRDAAGNEWVLTANADGVYTASVPLSDSQVFVSLKAETPETESTEETAESTESSASEEERFEEAKTDRVAAVTENGEALTVVAVDLNKYDAEKADDLTTTIDEKVAPGEVVAFFEVKVEGMAGPVVLTFKVDGVKASDDVVVIHWLTDDRGNETGEVEYIKPEAVRDGEVDAKFTSLSPIAIVVNRASDAQPEDNPVPEETEAPASGETTPPETGDAGYGISLAVCVIALCGTLLAIMMKKKQQDKLI